MTTDPTSPAAPAPTPPGDPKEMVKIPSFGLMASGGLYLVWILYLIGSTLLGFAIGGGGGGKMSWLFSGFGLIIEILFAVIFAGATLYGGMQMKNLKNYNLAMVGAIAAILPCSYCCCITTPVGIWALVILMKPEVKAAFGQGATPTV